MSASVSPHGFEIVRGRGYRPEDVDRRVEGLSIDRDSCWERAARLTVLANEMTAELAELREYVRQLPPQTYESLGDQARLILTTAESEAARLRKDAEEAAERAREEAEAYERQITEATDRAAQELRDEAEDWARRRVAAAWSEADGIEAAAAKDAEQWRSEAAEALRQMERRTAQMLREQEEEQTEQWDALGRDLAAQEADLEQRVAELEELGRAKVAEAERFRAETEEAARHRDEDAEARAADLLAQARIEVERIERATERILREHAERREKVREHMTHVRNTLAALTGKAPDEDEVAAEEGVEGAGATSHAEGGTVLLEKPGGAEADAAGAGTAEEAAAGPDGAADGAPSDSRAPVDPDNEDTLENQLPRPPEQQ
ncbi:cellulose-binding protein [Streptomyces sp. NRRL F-5755]|uniref:cellulose-binding protein n=1 Tax=Streptomyces sp. NRRL F-5755 TaxID=1519475 RepID=UPI0006C3DC02|nr:cellulose-binding protein [Streptomyces sp. NRRL F-5755]KOU00528.1 cellulose-binding protein [Streptomyces sp. NRRL F-5755]